MDKIEQFIKSLEKEIKETADNVYDVGALERLEDIAKVYSGEDKVVSSFEIVELMKTKPPEVKMFSGYGGIDNILDGFRHKQLVVLSASTGSGKTSFAIDLTTRLKEFNPLWFPFEEPAEELIQKFLDRGEEPPLFYTPKKIGLNTLEWIEERIIEAKAKYNSQIVFIDHLHFIVKFEGENISHQVGKCMRELKTLAKKWNIVIVLIAHLKKTQLDLQPTLEDLRDSSFIGQEADSVIMVWRQMEKVNGSVEISNNVNISIQKNRRTGKTGNVRMVFNNGKFYEQSWTTKDEEFAEM